MSTSSVVLVICMCLLTTHSVLSCNYNSDDRRANCASFEQLRDAGHQTEWWRLNVNNRGSGTFSPIKKDSFINAPNLIDVQVKGLANGIERGAFNGLPKLFELHLDDNKLQTIPANAFSPLGVQIIYIYFCEVETLQPRAFEGLRNLKNVNMYGNHMTTLKAGVFTGLNIEYLTLRKNRIEFVEDNAFGDMDQLVWLSLEENELTAFEPQLAIGFAPRITNLYINRNKLTEINRGMFSVLPKLRVLLLNINSIVRFGDHSFNDIRELRLLDISNNRLEEIQTNVFNPRGMQEMQLLFLHDNHMSFLSSGVLARLPKLQKMSVGGNPWQCPCWDLLDSYMTNHNITRLCYETYVQGDRPFCVFSDVHFKDCIFDLENVTDIPQIYADTIKEYPVLPKVCNVDGVPKPVLAA